MYKCKYCGIEFDSPRKLGGHVTKCKKNPNYNKYQESIKKSKLSKNPLVDLVRYCEICGSEYKLRLKQSDVNKGNYRKTCSDECSKILTSNNTNLKEKNNKISNSINSHYNEIKLSRVKHCEQCGNLFNEFERGKSRFCSDDCRKKYTKIKLSKSLKGKTGGYRPSSGNKYHKSGKYDGVYFDSSWELAFYIYHKDFNKYIERCDIEKQYIYNGKCHKYIPDFITDDGVIEIKGYLTDKSKEKLSQNPDVIVLYKNDIEPYINYVVEKYGENFWDNFYTK